MKQLPSNYANTDSDSRSDEDLPGVLAQLSESVRGYLLASLSAATRRAYASDWSIFAQWCRNEKRESLPADSETVTIFLVSQADKTVAPSTLSRRLAAIRYVHEGSGHQTPTHAKLVRATMQGIRRKNRFAKQQKKPLTASMLSRIVAHCDSETLIGLRDRALLSLGFAGAFRRSELVALQLEDIEVAPEGLRITIRKSKTDQEGEGQTIAVPNGAKLQVVHHLRAWLVAAGITSGPLFRGVRKNGKVRDNALADRTVAIIIKHYCQLEGLQQDDFAGHSLRSGFLTTAAENGASIFKMMEVSRHKRVDTLQGYVRMAELFKDHAGKDFL